MESALLRQTKRALRAASALCLSASLLVPVQASVINLNQIDTLYALGESLVDSGNVFTVSGGTTPTPINDTYFNGRFTNGFNVADYLSNEILGTTNGLQNSLAPGGTNFAYGAARLFGEPDDSASQVFSLLDTGGQLQQLVARVGIGGLDQSDLVYVWAGNNDWRDLLSDAAEALLAGGSTPDIPAILDGIALGAMQIGSDLTFLITQLRDLAGADNLVVANTPDLTELPSVQALGLPEELLALVRQQIELYNAQLAMNLLALPRVELEVFDAFTAFNNLPLINNNLLPCNPSADPSIPLADGILCGDPDSVIFWDPFHPTTAAHQQLSAAILAQIPIPTSSLLMLTGLMLLLRTRTKHVDFDASALTVNAYYKVCA